MVPEITDPTDPEAQIDRLRQTELFNPVTQQTTVNPFKVGNAPLPQRPGERPVPKIDDVEMFLGWAEVRDGRRSQTCANPSRLQKLTSPTSAHHHSAMHWTDIVQNAGPSSSIAPRMPVGWEEPAENMNKKASSVLRKAQRPA
jgi:hypothetical protein